MSEMKLTKIPPHLERGLEKLLAKYAISACLDRLYVAGATVFLVGGAVRDLFLDRSVKDVDLEVHGISLERLQELLEQCGPVSLVGKAFGVLRVHGIDIDWSVPRSDSAGRKPRVAFDASMNMRDAFARRDLTMNAMGINVQTHELYDPFNGQGALQKKVLATPDPVLFIEDPLRFFRVMQSIGRFEMYPDKQLQQLCTRMDISNISKERIVTEFEKLFLLSRFPSSGIRWLRTIGRLHEVLPELAATFDIVQDPQWHPEGDVFEHSMQSLDASAILEYESPEQKLTVMYGVLCHDLGKVTTTAITDGKITSYNHEQEGVQPARALLKRIVLSKDTIDAACLMVRHHMAPIQFVTGGASRAAYKRLARALYPLVTLYELALVSKADKQGRNPHGHEPLNTPVVEVEQFIARAQGVHVLFKPEPPLLQGKDLLDHIPPGPLLGTVLDRIYEIQIEHSITDKEELKKRALDFFAHLQQQQ